MRDDDPSADQDEWQDFARRLRAKIADHLRKVPDMTPEELEKYVDAARNALWLSLDAATIDKDIDIKNARITAMDGL